MARYVLGDVHAANARASSLHSNVAGSLAENLKVAVAALVRARGADSIVVLGAVTSIIHDREAAPRFPAASLARTTIAWPPSRRPPNDAGELHAWKPRSSMSHSYVAGSSAANAKVALVALPSDGGPDVTVTMGGRVSIVHERAASGPTLPTPSVAVTANV